MEMVTPAMERIAFSPREVAEMTGMNTRTILKEIWEGNLKANKIGRVWLISKVDIDTWLSKNNQQ